MKQKYSIVNYADITINDKNALKRKLQNLRLNHSLKVLQERDSSFSGKVLDFGAGNGELAKRLSTKFSNASFFCYEPSPGYLEQTKENIRGLTNVSSTSDISDLQDIRFDYIFCMEVLEHLPEPETNDAFDWFERLLSVDGKLVIGVPNELFLPALFKGSFRMMRRFGDSDARPLTILRSVVGLPPKKRPVDEIEQGIRYIVRHTGFDYRDLKKQLQSRFKLLQKYGSPLPDVPLAFNFECYFICSNK